MSKDKEFNPSVVEPYDDFKKVEHQADEYIYRILFGKQFFERYNCGVRPTVFMSMGILHTIARTTEHIQVCRPGNACEICGCPLKITTGKNELYIGFDLLENRL